MTSCLLCKCEIEELVHLYDATGHTNEIYQAVVQYFNPTLLYAPDQAKCVICYPCKRQIQRFHEFQRSILAMHTSPQTEDTFTRHIKVEECQSCSSASDRDEDSPMKEIFDKEPLQSTGNGEDFSLHECQVVPESEIVEASNHSYIDNHILDEVAIEVQSPSNSLKSLPKVIEKSRCDPITLTDCRRVTRSSTRRIQQNGVNNTEDTGANGKANRKNRSRQRQSEKNIEEAQTEMSEEKENNSNNSKKVEQRPAVVPLEGDKKINLKRRQDDFIRKWKNDLECVCCDATFDSLVTLRLHFRWEHSPQKCYILCCQRKLYTRTQIVEHISLHIDPNSFKCELCDKCFSERRTLLKHKKEKHTMEGLSRRFKCKVCNKGFTKLSILRCHEDMHVTGNKDHVCNLCGKAFVLAKRLKVHLRTTHGADRICDQCGRTFRSQRALLDHLMEHAGVSKPKWQCDLCDVALKSHASLKRHKEVRHNDRSKEYVCDICGKVTYTTYALRSHKKYVHQAIRKHKCNICGKAFKVAIILREHMASHTGNDLYKCPYCPKTFKVSSNMHHHRKKKHPVEWAEARKKKCSSIVYLVNDQQPRP